MLKSLTPRRLEFHSNDHILGLLRKIAFGRFFVWEKIAKIWYTKITTQIKTHTEMTIKGPLTYLLGHDKVKLLKFLLHNRDTWFTSADLSEKTRIPVQALRKELKQAEKHGVVEEKKKNKVLHYRLKEVEEVAVLEDIIFKLGDSFFEAMRERVEGLGTVQLCILLGAFLQREHDRVDLFLVVDDLNDRRFDTFIQAVESELGTEVRYALMTTKDFNYRRDMFDKFVLSILEDTRTRVLVDKSGIIEDN